jgi:hypothetical protein
MENIYGIEYSKPEVILLQDTGIGKQQLGHVMILFVTLKMRLLKT